MNETKPNLKKISRINTKINASTQDRFHHNAILQAIMTENSTLVQHEQCARRVTSYTFYRGPGLVGPGLVGPQVCRAWGLWSPGLVEPGACGAQSLWGPGLVGPGACGARCLWGPGIWGPGTCGAWFGGAHSHGLWGPGEEKATNKTDSIALMVIGSLSPISVNGSKCIEGLSSHHI
jgi:hypothetical protein